MVEIICGSCGKPCPPRLVTNFLLDTFLQELRAQNVRAHVTMYRDGCWDVEFE